MTINVAEALDSDTAIKVTVKRNTGGYVDGLWNPDAATTFKALASPQQPTAEQLERLPEGQRTNNVMLFICNKRLRTTDETIPQQADKIVFDGSDWEVIQLADWTTFGHCMAYAERITE